MSRVTHTRNKRVQKKNRVRNREFQKSKEAKMGGQMQLRARGKLGYKDKMSCNSCVYTETPKKVVVGEVGSSRRLLSFFLVF